MAIIFYLDEAGDETIPPTDKTNSVFALAMLAFDTELYANQVVPAFTLLKIELWGHESIIFHSRDIRRQTGDFAFLRDPSIRPDFYSAVNRLMSTLPYEIIPVAIHKDRVDPAVVTNPYDLALALALEGALPLVEGSGQPTTTIIAEARGPAIDGKAKAAFEKTIREGTSTTSAVRFQAANFRLVFIEKKMNVVGTQMADLVAYPFSRHVLDPSKPNPSYDVLRPKLSARSGFERGLRTYP